MDYFKHKVYNLSPNFIKRLLANIEAIKRDRFRRPPKYYQCVLKYDPEWMKKGPKEQRIYQLKTLVKIIKFAIETVPFYRNIKKNLQINTLEDIVKLPLLKKEHINSNPIKLISETVNPKKLWLCSTSGSTGTPLRFYHDKEITLKHQAVADAILSSVGCNFGQKRARISGALVVPYSQNSPPYWIFIDFYKQLQCSAYHLSKQTCKQYIEAIKKYKIEYGTGYPHAWLLLANYLLESNIQPPELNAIITDSEGISLSEQKVVELAFGCPVFQTYGTSEVGQVAMQCNNGRYHSLSMSCVTEILDENEKHVKAGEIGQIIVTDLTGLVSPFIRYCTGDLAKLPDSECGCGWNSPSWLSIEGRIDDKIITPEGRYVGRLSHILKPGIGINESQFVQVSLNEIHIKIVPGANYNNISEKLVIKEARRYLGDSMTIKYYLVNSIEREKSGKLKFVKCLI